MSQKKSQPLPASVENHYLAAPKSGKGPGVLVLHAWWGLTPFFKEFCDRLAKEGFVALAPDLYHGATAATIAEAKKLRSKLKQKTVVQEIIQAAAVLRSTSRKRFGVVGFSLGGYWALWLADQKASPVAATVVFYGSRSGNYAASRAAFQFHRAESDDYVSVSGVKKLAKALETARRPAKFYTYPNTTHWFFERDREAYDAEAADLAWHRTVEFLKKHVAEGRQKDKR